MDILLIKAHTIREAKLIASQYGLEHVANVTFMWEKIRYKNSRSLKAFQIDTLMRRRIWEKKGFGCLINLDNTKDYRIRHNWEVVDYKKTNGKRPVQKIYEIKLASDNTVIGRTTGKKNALKLAKKLMMKYRENITCSVVWQVMEGKDKAFDLNYIPEENKRFIIFGFINGKYEEHRKDFELTFADDEYVRFPSKRNKRKACQGLSQPSDS